MGGVTFPLGSAESKRRRYMVDYMNSNNIESHVLVTRHLSNTENALEGKYEKTDYFDISDLFNQGKFLSYYHKGKLLLKRWYKSNCNNVVIFPTVLEFFDYPLFAYAKSIGYKTVFDQLETNFADGSKNLSLKNKIHICLNNLIRSCMYNRCDGSFVISKALWRENRDRYPHMKLCILPNSTPILQIKPKQTMNHTPIILYTGTFGEKDGVGFLIDGFLEARRRGVNCKLVLTGKGRPVDMKVLEKVSGRDDVEYKGRVSEENLKSIMLNSDILTMTRINSRFANYGFPFKLSESLATGNPVIASDVSDVCSYVHHLESAYMVRPENSDDIANGIQFLVENPKKALEIGKKGLDVAEKNFGINVIGKIFIDFLAKL